MHTTIEANIKNGRVESDELKKLPPNAHVLITLMDAEREPTGGTPVFGCASGKIVLNEDFDLPLDDFAKYM